jgi:peptidoglycan/xylan/chitin deacetylase (PgdA/CDA1 family)
MMILGIVLFAIVMRARFLSARPVISRVTTSSPMVALTFDDGPRPPYTNEILTLLTTHHALATFFVLGQEAQAYPDLIRQEVKDHMELGLHGRTHLNLRRVGAAFMVQDAVRERDFLQRMVPGATMSLFRPPFGLQSPALDRGLRQHRLELVLWDVDTRDWTMPGVQYIVRQVERRTKPGSILLFHDGGGNRSETVAALKIILPWLLAHHYRMVTVSQLIAQAGQ